MENSLTFTSEYFLHGEHSQTQVYTKTLSEKVISIKQESIFRSEHEKDFKFECSYTITPAGYSRAQIDFVKPDNTVSFRVRKIDGNKLELYHNSAFMEIVETDKNEAIMFDGPSAAFDYFNYMYFVNSNNNQNIRKTVYYLDWLNGKILKESYEFKKDFNKLYIKKNSDYNEDSVVEFWDESYKLKQILKKNAVYFFKFEPD